MDIQRTSVEGTIASAPPAEKNNLLEKISFIIFSIALVLAPLAFIPNAYAPFEITKTMIIAFGILIAVFLVALKLLKKGAISIPRHPLFVSAYVLVLSLIASGFASTSL